MNDSELYWVGLGNWVNQVPFRSLYLADWPESWSTQFPNPNLRGLCFQVTQLSLLYYLIQKLKKKYSRTLVIWTLKGIKKQFELAAEGFELSESTQFSVCDLNNKIDSYWFFSTSVCIVQCKVTYFIKNGDMIMHFCDKTWSASCTNQNQIAVGL